MSRLHSSRIARRGLLCVRVADVLTFIYLRETRIIGQCDNNVQTESRAIMETWLCLIHPSYSFYLQHGPIKN